MTSAPTGGKGRTSGRPRLTDTWQSAEVEHHVHRTQPINRTGHGHTPGRRRVRGEEPVRQSRTLGSVRGEARATMATLYGHEAGNGGHSQGPTYGHVVASPTRSGPQHIPAQSLRAFRKATQRRHRDTMKRSRQLRVRKDAQVVRLLVYPSAPRTAVCLTRHAGVRAGSPRPHRRASFGCRLPDSPRRTNPCPPPGTACRRTQFAFQCTSDTPVNWQQDRKERTGCQEIDRVTPQQRSTLRASRSRPQGALQSVS